MTLSPGTERQLKAAAVIGYSVFSGLLVLVITEELIRLKLRPFLGFFDIPLSRVVRYAFFAIAALTILAILVVRRKLLRRRPGEEGSAFGARLTRLTVIILGLAEVPGLLGFVLFLLFGHNQDFYALLFVSALLIFMFFPRRSVWEELIHYQ